MGNNDSKLTVFSNCKEIRKWTHPLLGSLSELLVEKGGQTCFLKIRMQTDLTIHKEALQKFKQRKTNKHLLQIQKLEESKSQQFCSTSLKLYLFLEPFHYDLEYLYNKKSIAKQPFLEEELTEILVACVNGLLFIQDNDLRKYHLSKQSIVYSGRDIKILDGGIVDKPHPFYNLMGNDKVENDIFLAPQLLQDLKDNMQPYLAPKTDIFTIGMLLLHLAALEPLSHLYDYQNFTLDHDGIEDKIGKIKYSQFLKEIIRAMVQKDEEERPGLISTQDMLGINSRRETVRLDSYRSLKNNSYREKQTSKTESHDASLRMSSRNQILRSYKELPDIKEESQKNSSSSCLGASVLQSVERNKRSKLFAKDSDKDKQNEMTPLPKITQRLYKLTHSIEQSPISRLDIQACSPVLNKLYERIAFENGSFYQGEVSGAGLMQGNGVLHYASGKVAYSGSWSEGQFEGFGTLHNENPKQLKQALDYKDFSQMSPFWIRYQGEFQNDCRHGFGTIFLTNGQRYAGCFKNDQVQGYGTYYLRNGTQVNGIWNSNKLQAPNQ